MGNASTRPGSWSGRVDWSPCSRPVSTVPAAMEPETLRRVVRPQLSVVLPDARVISTAQRAIALVRPWPPALVYLIAASHGWWALAALAVPCVFAADVVLVHDLFHRNLGLR